MIHVAILVVLVVIALVLAPWLLTIFSLLVVVVIDWLSKNFLTMATYFAAFVAVASVAYFGGRKMLEIFLEKKKVRATPEKVGIFSEPPIEGEHWSERVKRLSAVKDDEWHKRNKKMKKLQDWADKREAERRGK